MLHAQMSLFPLNDNSVADLKVSRLANKPLRCAKDDMRTPIDLLNNADGNRNHLLPNIDDINLCKSPEFGNGKV